MADDEMLNAIMSQSEALAASIMTAIPCRVDAYHSSRATVDLVPCVFHHQTEAVGGSFVGESQEEYPKLLDVPVCWPASGAVSLSWAMSAGDYCLFVCTSEDPSGWLESGSVPSESPIPGRHGLHGFALPGINVTKDKPPGADYAGMKAVAPKFMLTSAAGAAEKALALAEKVDSELTKVQTSITSIILSLTNHNHVSAPPGSSTGPGIIIPPAPSSYSSSPVASTKVFTNG